MSIDPRPTRPSPSIPCPAAADIVGSFLQNLRRRDLDALAALLGAAVEADHPTAAAWDRAQAVLRSFGGSGLVDTGIHPSSDGRTVFVEFGPDSPDGSCWTGQSAVRLVRFTTSGEAITGICEYTEVGSAEAGAAVAASGTGSSADWPSLGRERGGEHRPGRR